MSCARDRGACLAAAVLAGAAPGGRRAAHRVADQSSRDDHVELYRRRAGAVRLGRARRRERGAARPYDIVATVIGPRESLRTRRKQRVLGIWVNTAARTFVDPPSYLAVLANRPLDAIASAENRRRLQLGIADTPLPELINNDIGEVSNDPFRAALVRLMRERGLYSEEAERGDVPDADAVSRRRSRCRRKCRSATTRSTSSCSPTAT